MTIKTAVKQWIRAEYAFRFGNDRHSLTTQEWLVRAEERLRKAMTGKRGLSRAYRIIKNGGRGRVDGRKNKASTKVAKRSQTKKG